MRKAWLVAALLAAMGCDSATASEGAVTTRPAVQGARGNDVLDDWPVVPPPAAIVSTRRVVNGLYGLRARLIGAEGPVTLVVRVAPVTYGFPSLDSGVEVLRFEGVTRVDTQLQVDPSYRYLILAIPGEADPMLLDYTLAAYTEIVP